MTTATELRKEVSEGKEQMKKYLQTLETEAKAISTAKGNAEHLFTALKTAIESGNINLALTAINTFKNVYFGHLDCYANTLEELRTSKIEGSAEMEKYFLLVAELKDRGMM